MTPADFSFRQHLKGSISREIVLFLLCFAVIPMMAVIGIFSYLGSYTHKKEIIEVQHEVAERVSQSVRLHLENNVGSVELLAHCIGQRVGDVQAVKQLLSDFLAQGGDEFDMVSLALPDGKVVAKLSRYHTYRPDELWSISGEEGFQRARAGQVTLGGIGISPFSRFPLLKLYVPITVPSGEVTGVLCTDISISRMWRLVSKSFIGENLDAYIVDGQGFLLAYDELSAVLNRRDLRDIQGVKRFLANEPGVSEYSGIRDVPVIGVVSSVALTGWGIVVETPLQSAYRHVNLLWSVLGAASLVVILLTTAFGLWYSSRNILQPIRTLQKDVQILATGNLQHSITLQRTDELGQLANDLTRMAESLRTITVSRDLLLHENEERIKTEEALRHNERRLADIIDFLPDPILAVDDQKRIIIWNRAIEEMTGIPAGEMLGKGDYAYTVPFYGEARPQLMDLIWENREDVEVRYPFVNREGHSLITEVFCPALYGGRGAYVFAKASPLHDQEGKIIGAIESVRDVTAGKDAEKGRQMLAAAVEQAAEGVLITDAAGSIVFVNPAFESITGYRSDEVLGRNPRILKSGKQDASFYRGLWETISSGCVWKGRLVNCRKSGAFYTEECTISPIRDRSGALSHFVSVKRDITDVLKTEEQLKQAQKMEAIGTLAGGIAHDFNNILTPIMGYAEMALYQLPQEGRLRRNLEKVLSCSQRARDLVKQILAFSRQSDEERRPVQMSAIITEALTLLRASLPATIEIRCVIQPEAKELFVLADPTQIHQILMNLGSNAAQAMQGERGVLQIELHSAEVNEDLVALHPHMLPGSYVRLSFQDTGIGMDPSVLERIFDPYYTTKGPGEGTGLGLAMVYGIIKSYQGLITVQSKPEEGTRFEVLLPTLAYVERTPATDGFKSLPCVKGKALLVDDEEMVVESEKQMLEALGFEVTVHRSALDALGAFRAQPDLFDVVITDMTMPQMTGAELTGEILKIRPQQAVILCTGYSSAMDESEAGRLGIRAFLMKPISFQGLAEAIDGALTQ